MNLEPQRRLRWTGRLWEAAAVREDKRSNFNFNESQTDQKVLSEKVKSMSRLNSLQEEFSDNQKFR